MLGVVMALGAAFFWGVNAVFIKKGVEGGELAQGTYLTLVINLLITALVAFTLESPRHLLAGGWGAIGLFCVVGVLHQFCSRLCYYRSIDCIGASRASALTGAELLVTPLLAGFFLQERMTVRIALGTGLILAGTWVILQERDRHP